MASTEFAVMSRRLDESKQRCPLGPRSEIEAALALLNTAPDSPGGQTLFGPGFELDFTPGQDPVQQILVLKTDDTIFDKTIREIAKKLEWMLVDLESGDVEQP